MGSEEPVLFSKFGLKGQKDRHLRYVMRRIGVSSPSIYCYRDQHWMAVIWLTDLALGEWNSLGTDVKNRLVSDLLNALHCGHEQFDVLFDILFYWTPHRDIELGTDRSAVAADILRSGLEHSFLKDGQVQNILDYHMWSFVKLYCYMDGPHLRPSPLRIFALCPCAKRPLYVAFLLALPELVRLLLNFGARLHPEDVCRCKTGTACHPLHTLFHIVCMYAEDTRRQWDILSLRLLLVDAPASLRRDIRCRFGYISDVTEEIPSLKHVARASVRQQLRVSRRIGQRGASERCGLPKSLQSYIYMEDVVTEA